MSTSNTAQVCGLLMYGTNLIDAVSWGRLVWSVQSPVHRAREGNRLQLLVAFAAACIGVSTGAAAAEAPAIVTLVEGQAALLRGTTRFALAEGVRLQGGDIVEIPEQGLAQVEFADGALLSLGPRSRFYAATLVARGAKAG